MSRTVLVVLTMRVRHRRRSGPLCSDWGARGYGTGPPVWRLMREGLVVGDHGEVDFDYQWRGDIADDELFSLTQSHGDVRHTGGGT